MPVVILQMGGWTMNSLKHYVHKLKRSVFHKNEEFALEGGIFFGPGSDPKGSFYSSPKLNIYWNQPNSVVFLDEVEDERGLLKSWFSKIGKLRRSA
jgi:hypothetical protein